MRKLISLAAGLALASTVFVAVPASAEPAMVLRDQGLCAMPGVNEDGGLDFARYSIGAVTHVVQKDDRVVTTCKGSGLTNLRERTQHFSGFTCISLMLNDDLTVNDYRPYGVGSVTIGKKGRGTLKCVATLPVDVATLPTE